MTTKPQAVKRNPREPRIIIEGAVLAALAKRWRREAKLYFKKANALYDSGSFMESEANYSHVIQLQDCAKGLETLIEPKARRTK